MQSKLLVAIIFTSLVVGYSSNSEAEMTSDNYRITSSVLSGGGASAGSANYQINGTVGQPTPLMDPMDQPYSKNYDLYPGFWYAVAGIGEFCPGDSDFDKDVDGLDLAEYISDSGGLDLNDFAMDFGKVNCP